MAGRLAGFVRFLGFAAVLQAAASADARNWPTTGGWDIAQGTDNCAMGQEFEGEGATLLSLAIGADGRVIIALTNYNWSAVERQEYQLTYAVDDTLYEGGASLGIRDGYRKGFGALLPPEFIDTFARGSTLRIFNGTVLIDSLSLDGTGAAVTVLRRCAAVMRAEVAAAERDRARLAHIPRDPFAPGTPERPGAPAPPVARAGLQGLITADDYPAEALKASEQGAVTARLSINTEGRVSDCAIVQGATPELDAATCRLLQARARFTPARDAAGNPVAGEMVAPPIRWSIQDE